MRLIRKPRWLLRCCYEVDKEAEVVAKVLLGGC